MATNDLIDKAKQLAAAIEHGATGDALAAFFHPDVLQEEFPNRISPTGGKRDLAGLLASAESGKKLMAGQRYEVLNAISDGSTVVLEIAWTGTLAIPMGTLPAGGEMRARFCQVLEYKDGKVFRIRNYDCIYPW